MPKLSRDFYTRPDVVRISRELLGKWLFTRIDGKITAGIITETEAYAGIIDKASHAYGNRRTARTEIMYARGGTAYVYLCYGIHHLFNIVTNGKDNPHAVLVRGIYPIEGIEHIFKRRGLAFSKKDLPLAPRLVKRISGGPGTVSQALGIKTSHSGIDLLGNIIWLEDRGTVVREKDIIAGPRIGVDYAGEDAKLPYRFWVQG